MKRSPLNRKMDPKFGKGQGGLGSPFRQEQVAETDSAKVVVSKKLAKGATRLGSPKKLQRISPSSRRLTPFGSWLKTMTNFVPFLGTVINPAKVSAKFVSQRLKKSKEK